MRVKIEGGVKFLTWAVSAGLNSRAGKTQVRVKLARLRYMTIFLFSCNFFNSYCNYCVYQWFFFYNNSCFVSSAHNFYTSNIVLQIHEKNVLFFKNRFIWLLDWHFLNLRSSSIGRNIGSLSHSITPVIKTIFFS